MYFFIFIDDLSRKVWVYFIRYKSETFVKLNARLEKIFLADTVNMACNLINRSSRVALDRKVAEEVWTGNEVDYCGLRVFSCLVYVHIPCEERSKLDPKSGQCVFLGYEK